MNSNVQFNPQTELRRCHHCHANLPLVDYGLFKPDPKGYAKICKLCRSEMNQTKWTKKYGRKKALPDAIIRGVLWHNRHIMSQVVQSSKMELRGFDTQTKMEYKVFWGPTERTGLQALSIFNRSGTMYIEWALSGVRDVQATLLEYLKAHNIRLEYCDEDVIASKTTIYYV